MNKNIRIINAIIVFFIFKVEAEAITDQDTNYFTISNFTKRLVIKLQPVIPDRTVTTTEVDMSIDPDHSGSIENIRFTKVNDLEKIVAIIIKFKDENPISNAWAVFDVDETLIDRSNPTQPIHPQTDKLFQRLKTKGIPILLLTMSAPPEPKFKYANLTYDGVIHEGLLSRDRRGIFIPKGKRLQQYINTLPRNQHPSHVFFADDKLFSERSVINIIGKIAVYIESVEATMHEMGIPFTTFHFQKKH